jgi:hypothetical protein
MDEGKEAKNEEGSNFSVMNSIGYETIKNIIGGIIISNKAFCRDPVAQSARDRRLCDFARLDGR